MIVHQAMAGYDHGHYLRTLTLSGSSYHRRIESLSDLSGYIPSSRGGTMIPVPPHLTLYPCGEHYVVQRTWYDDACERRGCVLSHALIVELDAVATFDLRALCALHRRPASARERDPYARPLEVDLPPCPAATFGEDCDHDARALSKTWHHYAPVRVHYRQEESALAEDLLIRSWRYNHPANLRVLSASTFALSLRTTPAGTPFMLSLSPEEARPSFRTGAAAVMPLYAVLAREKTSP